LHFGVSFCVLWDLFNTLTLSERECQKGIQSINVCSKPFTGQAANTGGLGKWPLKCLCWMLLQ